jgi:Prefoldin subunit.
MNENEYDELRQRLQIETSQKQAAQLQYNDIKRTIEEIEKAGSDELFELSGQILIKKDKETLKKELSEKSEILEYRMKSINKSVEDLTKQVQDFQKQLEKN